MIAKKKTLDLIRRFDAMCKEKFPEDCLTFGAHGRTTIGLQLSPRLGISPQYFYNVISDVSTIRGNGFDTFAEAEKALQYDLTVAIENISQNILDKSNLLG